MYPGLSHDEIIEECLKELKHHFEVGPEVALISAEKGVQCVPFDESLQKKFPYFEGTYEVFDVPHTDFQIRYQPEQILAASGRKILTGTAFLCRRENERCLMLPSRYEKVDVEDFIREHLFFYAVMDKVAETEELSADHRPSTLEMLAALASDTSAPKSSARSAPEL